jgi:hypothetical protein
MGMLARHAERLRDIDAQQELCPGRSAAIGFGSSRLLSGRDR